MPTKLSVQFGSITSMAAMALLAIAATGSAIADPITFAQYDQTSGSTQQWKISVTGDTTKITASGTVDFSFDGIAGAPVGPQVANFKLSATSTTDGTTDGLAFSEAGFSGTFSFIDSSLPTADRNLLSGTFQFVDTGAQLNESIGGTGGGFGASDTAVDLQELVMTSAYIPTFAGQTDETSTFTLSSLIPGFTAGGTADRPTNGPYTASGVGTFSSEAEPDNSGPAVPEPATFSMIAGGLLLGAGLVRRNKAVRS